MLKFIYTETGLHLEYLPQSQARWITLRVDFARRLGQSLSIESCTASLLLRAELVEAHALATELTLIPCDADYGEVSLTGTWVTSDLEQVEGVFLVTLGDRLELLLLQLWQESETYVSSPSG